ncbi:MAG TPA: hypothetical protein VFL91_08500 [Thermomicrobiales bacterium]|nr:hypothetical protein [Thermomicrobiales bacterium]
MSGTPTAAGPMPDREYIYDARLERVIDGDTAILTFDFGFGEEHTESVRLLGVNCPEVTGATRAAGLAAKDYTERWLAAADTPPTDWPLVAQSFKSDHFGRWLAFIWRKSDRHSLNDDLLADGQAVPDPGP